MTEDEREDLARLAYAAHLVRFGGAAGPGWDERDEEQRDFYRVVAEVVAAEVRRRERATVAALVAAARDVDTARRSLDYAAPELVAAKIGRLDAAMERLRAALAALEEDR